VIKASFRLQAKPSSGEGGHSGRRLCMKTTVRTGYVWHKSLQTRCVWQNTFL